MLRAVARGRGPVAPPGRSVASLVAEVARAKRRPRPPQPPGWEQGFRDSFVPLSKEQLRGLLLAEFHPSGGSRASFLAFAARLDRALQPRYQRLHEHLQHPLDEVQVSVDLAEYEEIQFWALGQRVGPLPDAPPPPRRWLARAPRPPPHRRYFRRVVVLARPRGSRLVLKAFKEVPLEALELLLPRLRVRTPGLQRARLHLGLAASGLLLFLNVGLVLLTDAKVGATALLLGFAALMAVRGSKAFARRRDLHALELAHSRYRRSTAHNGALVAELTRRAQDEAAKEALLAHSFLQRCPPAAGGATEAWLQAEVEAWLRRRLGLALAFPAQRACGRLRSLGEGGGLPPPPPLTPPHGTQGTPPGHVETPPLRPGAEGQGGQ